MPTIRERSATSSNLLSGKKFNVIGGQGGVMNVWATGATAGDTFGVSVGSTEIIVDGTIMNVEASTHVVDTDRDQMVFNEIVPAGEIYAPCTVTTALNLLIHYIEIV